MRREWGWCGTGALDKQINSEGRVRGEEGEKRKGAVRGEGGGGRGGGGGRKKKKMRIGLPHSFQHVSCYS